MKSLRLFPDSEALAQELARCWHDQTKQAVENQQEFSVVISGGSTAPILYGKLAEPEWHNRIPWNCVHIFFADERCIPPDNEESNYKNIYDNLLRHISIPEENIHRIKGEEDPEKEAFRYSREIQHHLDLKKTKLFDWVLLGIGEDGHTASLFPGQNTLDSTNFCEATRHTETRQHRITMTPMAINKSDRITYHVIGEKKAEIVSKITTHPSSQINYPASKIPGELFLDKKAASKIDYQGIINTDLSS